jgi:hypothetical protein
MFLIAMFFAYFDYMYSIVSYLWSLYICLYSAHPLIHGPGVSDMHYVSMVLRYIMYLRMPSAC